MNPSRIVQNIVRRLPSGDNLFPPVTATHLQTETAGPLIKQLDKTNIRSLSTSFQQLRTMATDNTASTSTSVKHSNRLKREKSPYLLQHATNPVDWYPWGEEAFDKARKENKLIFLSVGYSTCHWCHVMEKESFENDSVAEIMNRHYVNIKVDREERPDVDRVYMSFIQASSGGGGWPMSVFLTPNLEPITGGTYFPPEDSRGRPGFKTLLNTLAERWRDEKTAILQSGKQIIEILKRTSDNTAERPGEAPPKLTVSIPKAMEQFTKSYEPKYGGFSPAPKFPQPANFDFLFYLYSQDTQTERAEHILSMCLHTLKCMANGGIHDHVSNGFARYSVDSQWHIPHFEKMLYDQGQLVVAYCNAYLATKDPFFEEIIHDILLYVSRDLSHESGGFYSAEDADSYPTEGAPHKKEGAFCIWEYDEILKHVTDKTGNLDNVEIFVHHFNIKKQGNVNPYMDFHKEFTNKNILITFNSIEETAEYFEVSPEKIKESLQKSLKMLYEARQQRPRPHLDSKMLTGWNGLMISGFAKAGEILKEQKYIDRAIKAANFIKQNLYNKTEGSLTRCCYRGNKGQIVQNPVPIVGFLDDYAFLIKALIDLYESTLDASWLEWAENLQNTQNRLFWDDSRPGFFTSPEGDTSVLIRVKDDHDGAEPAGNSISAQNLLRLGAYLEVTDFKAKAERLLASFSERLIKVPVALPAMMSALILYNESPTQVFIVGERDDPQTVALIDTIRSRLMPGRLIVLADGPTGPSALLYKRLDILSKLKAQRNKPTAYVCHHHACSLPVTSPEDLVSLLEEDLKHQRRQ